MTDQDIPAPPDAPRAPSPFERELEHLLNRHSVENESDTPDFILAQYLRGCLDVWTGATRARDKWYGDVRWPKEPLEAPEPRTINDVLGGPYTPDLQVVPPCQRCGRPRGEHASVKWATDQHWCPLPLGQGLARFSETEYFIP